MCTFACNVLTKAGPGKVWVDQTFLGKDPSQFFQRGIIIHLWGGANTYKVVYWFWIKNQNKKTNILYIFVSVYWYLNQNKKKRQLKTLNW